MGKDYDFGNKRQYRRNIYAFADRCLSHRAVKSRLVLILEDAEGLEAAFLQRRGYRAENIYAVNREPAILAHTTRSLLADGLARVRTISGEVWDVARDLRRQGISFDVIHLDFMGGVSRKLLDVVEDFRNDVIRPDSVVVINALRGREFDDALRMSVAAQRERLARAQVVTDVNGNAYAPSTTNLMDMARVGLLFEHLQGYTNDDEIGCHFHLAGLVDESSAPSFRFGTYRSTAGSQTMQWVAAHLREHRRGWMNDLSHEQVVALREHMIQSTASGYAMGLFPPCFKALAIAFAHGVLLREHEVADDGTTTGATYPIDALGLAGWRDRVTAVADRLRAWMPAPTRRKR